ncbi:MAG: GNAT family N-acetyltransferase [Turicibacter sp.]|nr:GNAT family N-acetyltransferase [Turicibacter sp.]
MKILMCQTKDEFCQKYLSLIQREACCNQLFIEMLSETCDIKQTDLLICGSVSEDQGQKLIFYNDEPYHLYLYDMGCSEKAYARLSQFLLENDVKIHSLNGSPKEVGLFMKYYPKNFELSGVMNVMMTKEQVELSFQDGHLIQATINQLHDAIKMYDFFAKEVLNTSVDYPRLKRKMKQLIEAGECYFWVNSHSKLVSMIHIDAHVGRGISFSGVYTLKEYRGMGYASALVSKLSETFLSKGHDFCTLMVDQKDNIPQRVYEKVGYQVIGENYYYKLVEECK